MLLTLETSLQQGSNKGGNPELSVINPVWIFGLLLSADLSSLFELLKRVLCGSTKAICNITPGIAAWRISGGLTGAPFGVVAVIIKYLICVTVILLSSETA